FNPSRPLHNKTPGTDYSGEKSERKTETKPLTEMAKEAAKTGVFANLEPRQRLRKELEEITQVIVLK
ncbi:hypothetical protein, partial [Aestuariivirga sp.]|uniref:hypothetical protein n=1 Tax=Aestuariivirga sp. TaxID=2650926 RepID=UPI003019B36B